MPSFRIEKQGGELRSNHRVYRCSDRKQVSCSVTAHWLSGCENCYVFLTNNFKLSAKTIANIYKARWQVEFFFKWIKQNLKIKSFVGTSKNAVLTQIWIVLCIYFLLGIVKFQSKLQKSMQQILRVLSLNLFEKRDLMSAAQWRTTTRLSTQY